MTQQQEHAVNQTANELATTHTRAIVTRPDTQGTITVGGLDTDNNIRELAFVDVNGNVSRHDA